MKKRLVAGLLWALLCALLWGCGPQAEAGLPRRLSPTKQTENDNLRCFPLACANCRFFAFEGDLLMLTQEEGSATLCRYAGRQLLLTGLAQVPEDALLCPGAEIGCYSPGRQEYWALSQDLSGCTCFSLPQCTGAPLALEGKIYYCTPQGLMELDTQTLLHRTLRQQQGLGLSTLLAQQGLAVCTQSGSREQLCIRLEDGSLAQTAPEILGAAEFGSQERLCLRLGYTHCLYLGQRELALPLGWEFLDFVPGRNEVLVYQPREALALYDLSTGNRMAALPLPSPGKPEAVSVTRDGRVYVRYGELLYQWEPEREARQDSRIVITPLYTPQQPDTKGLAQCRQRGAFLENQYGARVLLNTDVLQAAPLGCVLEPEHLRLRVLDTLSGMEAVLGKFPATMIRSAFGGRGRTYLCPVRSIRVEGAEQPSILFWKGEDRYLAVAASAQMEQGVLEALFPLLDRQVLISSDAFDIWPGENPARDRLELLRLAIQPGNRELFLDAVLQNKLRTLTAGLREAFSLPPSEKLLWEQYLWKQC